MGKNLYMPILAITTLFVFSISSVYAAEYANPGLLATPKTVTDNIDKPDWIVIDCRDKADYDKEHISGAIYLGDRCDKVMRDSTSRMKKVADLEKLLGDAGISENTHIVLYGKASDPTRATVGFWILETLGHKEVHFLNGGFESYKAAGGKVDNIAVTKPKATYKASYVATRYASTEEMLKIAKGEIKNEDVQVIDSRTEKEDKGTDIRALRGGRIPGTDINVDHTLTFDSKTGMIKSMDELEKLFGPLDKSKRTIAYCQTGTRSTLTYLELRLMGFTSPVNYDDSWQVWGSRSDTPIEGEQWYDFASLNTEVKKIASIEKIGAEALSGVIIVNETATAAKATADSGVKAAQKADEAAKKAEETGVKAAQKAQETADMALATAAQKANRGQVFGAYLIGIIGILVGIWAGTKKKR